MVADGQMMQPDIDSFRMSSSNDNTNIILNSADPITSGTEESKEERKAVEMSQNSDDQIN